MRSPEKSKRSIDQQKAADLKLRSKESQTEKEAATQRLQAAQDRLMRLHPLAMPLYDRMFGGRQESGQSKGLNSKALTKETQSFQAKRREPADIRVFESCMEKTAIESWQTTEEELSELEQGKIFYESAK